MYDFSELDHSVADASHPVAMLEGIKETTKQNTSQRRNLLQPSPRTSTRCKMCPIYQPKPKPKPGKISSSPPIDSCCMSIEKLLPLPRTQGQPAVVVCMWPCSSALLFLPTTELIFALLPGNITTRSLFIGASSAELPDPISLAAVDT